MQEICEQQEMEKALEEPDWDPPKVMMMNQLWMWVIDGGKVSFIIITEHCLLERRHCRDELSGEAKIRS
jgi:hypothetical protein